MATLPSYLIRPCMLATNISVLEKIPDGTAMAINFGRINETGRRDDKEAQRCKRIGAQKIQKLLLIIHTRYIYLSGVRPEQYVREFPVC